jgi:hypothetical protein
MRSHRLILAHVLMAGVIGGSLYDIATRQEHWPFSNYPMFSTIHREAVLTWPRLFGVTADGREIALLAYEYLKPLDQSRLPLGLRRLSQLPGADARLRAALADVLSRYEQRREAHAHEGPPLKAIRFYSVDWPLEPFAANLATPSSRTLIAEVGAAAGVRP